MDVNATKHAFLTIETDGKEKSRLPTQSLLTWGETGMGVEGKWCLVTTAWLK